MKIVIVENPRPLTVEHYNDVANAPLSASLNSGYALAIARRADWDTVHLDFSSGAWDAATMAARILAESGDIILFHWVYSWGFEKEVSAVMALLRSESPAPLGAFGLFPTLSRRRLLQYAPQLDFILAGEFEGTLAELLPAFGKRQTITTRPGVLLRDEPFVPRTLLADLDLLPIPDEVGTNCSYPSLNIAASRGCFGACSFCFIHRYYGCSRRRVRNPASLGKELATRLASREIENLYFIDPTFIGHGKREQERAVEISRLARGLGLPFGFEARVDTIDERVMATLAKNGATSVFLGIESGCDTVLERIGKRISTEQIRRGVKIVRESGLQLNLGFIMFEPDSTLAELVENYSFLEELGLLAEHELTANLLYHNQIVLHGSAAWERFEKEERLLLDERLPFEARYRFRDDRVGHVCGAMGRLSSAYFSGLDTLRKTAGAGKEACCSFDDVNALLKEAFLALCSGAETLNRPNMTALEESYLHQLRTMPLTQAVPDSRKASCAD
jgi:anaerobic magnesium-protoporphyrin IX monomethyl ester cyclase